MTEINPFLLLSMFVMLGATFFFTLMAILQKSKGLGLAAFISAVITAILMIGCGVAWQELHSHAKLITNLYKML